MTISSTRLIALSLAGLAAIGALPAGGRDQPAPGQYQVTTTTTYTDVPVPDATVTTEHCLEQADLDRDPASAFTGLPEGRGCDIGEFVMEGGIIRMNVDCSAADGEMVMVTSGTYDADGYQMTAEVTILVGDERVTMQSKIDGRRLGDC
jgi:hypothetical protein